MSNTFPTFWINTYYLALLGVTMGDTVYTMGDAVAMMGDFKINPIFAPPTDWTQS